MDSIQRNSSAKLCQKCQDVIDDWFRLLKQDTRSHYELEIGHYANISDLERSAHDECGLCARFIGSLDPVSLDILRRSQTRVSNGERWTGRVSIEDTGSGEWLLSSYFNPPVLDENGFPVAPTTALIQSDFGMLKE